MTDRFEQRHHAECPKCGYIEPDSRAYNGKFISGFFLPAMCAGCGEYPDWQHVIRKMELKPGRRSWNPLEWFSKWVEVSQDTMPARR